MQHHCLLNAVRHTIQTSHTQAQGFVSAFVKDTSTNLDGGTTYTHMDQEATILGCTIKM